MILFNLINDLIMAKFDLKLLLKIVSAVITAVLGVLLSPHDVVDDGSGSN